MATNAQTDAAIARVAANPTGASSADRELAGRAATQEGDRGSRAKAAVEGNRKPTSGGWGILGD